MNKKTEKKLDTALRKFKSAYRKMRGLSGRKYFSVELQVNEYSDGATKIVCYLYNRLVGSIMECDNWEDAFAELNKKLKALPND